MSDAPNKKSSRRLIEVQMNMEEFKSLPPLLRAKIIDRAQRKYAAEARLAQFQDALDCEEDP